MADDFNNPPPRPPFGTRLTHSGNGKTYIVLDIAWNGDTDEWGYLHKAAGEDGPLIWRPMSHITGHRSNGQPRYKDN